MQNNDIITNFNHARCRGTNGGKQINNTTPVSNPGGFFYALTQNTQRACQGSFFIVPDIDIYPYQRKRHTGQNNASQRHSNTATATEETAPKHAPPLKLQK